MAKKKNFLLLSKSGQSRRVNKSLKSLGIATTSKSSKNSNQHESGCFGLVGTAIVAIVVVYLFFFSGNSQKEETISSDIQQAQPVTVSVEPRPEVPSQFQTIKIVKVLDAATFDAEIDGNPEKIRLDYVDIPELRKEKPDFYSQEATEFVKGKIENKEAYIDKEPYTRDKFDRIVTSVWIDLPSNEKSPTDEDITTKMLNAVLLAEGCARIYEADHMSLLVDWDLFKGLQSDAQKAQKGIWKQQAPAAARKEILLVGNRNSRVLHEPSCSSANRMNVSNRVMLTYVDAMDRGYKPCQRCYPTGPIYQ